MSNIRYVALLRGINVGGHKPIKMEQLRTVFESIGLMNVKTLLASGNVLFETSEKDISELIQKLEHALEKSFNHPVHVLIRTINDIHKLIDSDPFKGITVTAQTRLYVTFLKEKSKHALNTSYESADKNFKIVYVSDSEVCSVLTLVPSRTTTDLMGVLEKELGRAVTTRNWNTVKKIVEVRQ